MIRKTMPLALSAVVLCGLSATANAAIGDGIADFYYDPSTGELIINDDGESPWAIIFNTVIDPISTSTPTGWTFINEATNFQFGDNSFGGNPLATGLDTVFATLPMNLQPTDFGSVQYFIQADFDEHLGSIEFITTPVPEPASLALLAIGGAVVAGRRRVA